MGIVSLPWCKGNTFYRHTFRCAKIFWLGGGGSSVGYPRKITPAPIWGSGVINQVSLDLKAAFPEAQGFSTDNLYRMARFYKFYSEQNEIVAQVVQ